jgi:allantoicase
VDIDTNHFLGNHPPFASLEGAFIEEDETITDYEIVNWKVLLPSSPLEPGSHNYYEITDSSAITHVRLHIYPDGGVARLKVYGEVVKDWSTVNTSETINLAAATNGARAVLCNDMFFSHMDNLLLPGRGVNMGDGWETKRNRTPGNCDWVIIRLAHKGTIERILVDTCHFKGNYPDSCQLDGCSISLKEETKLNDPALEWKTILPKSKLSADHEHYFEKELVNKEPFTHIRLSIYPDGGVSRLKLWGRISNR